MNKSIDKSIDKSILDLINSYMLPKESEKKEFGEVFTPLFLVEEMLAHLPANIWQNKELKWFDPSSGIGIFAIIIYYKLLSTLKPIIKNDKERSKWIIEKMIYLNELNPVNVSITKQIFGTIDPDSEVNIECEDYCKDSNQIEYLKYNIIVGNPPYNKSRLNGTFNSSLYPQFVVKALSMLSDDGKLLFITPSRWFSGGNGLNGFKDYMLKRNDIALIKHYDNSKTIWPTIDIAGGINYFLIDLNRQMNISINNGLTHFIDAATGKTSDINLNTYDILVQNVDAYSIINKVLKESGENNEKLSSISSLFVNPSFTSTFQGQKGISEIYNEKPSSISSLFVRSSLPPSFQRGISAIYLSTKYFGINTNSEHFHKEPDKLPESEPDKEPIIGSLIKCYVSKKKGSIKYVAASCIKNPYNFWKVFTPQANGKINDGFGTLIIGSPDEIASQTFFTFKVNSRLEAESLKSYLETDYANFMLNLRKIDHHINKNTLEWLLLPPLNQIWTNDSINSLFALTKREINTITSL